MTSGSLHAEICHPPGHATRTPRTVPDFKSKRWMDVFVNVWCECFCNMVERKFIVLILRGNRLLPWLPRLIRAIDAVFWLLNMARTANLHHVQHGGERAIVGSSFQWLPWLFRAIWFCTYEHDDCPDSSGQRHDHHDRHGKFRSVTTPSNWSCMAKKYF